MTNRDRYKEAELGRSPQLNFRATPTDGMRFPQRHSLCDWLEKKNSNDVIYHLLWSIAVTISRFQNVISTARNSMTVNPSRSFTNLRTTCR